MFVKIVHKPIKGFDPVMGIYECKFAEIKIGNKPKLYIVTMDDETKEFVIPDGHPVFFLNNDGKTIDKFIKEEK